MSPCPLDGNIRHIIEREPDAVIYRCSWCKQVSREELDTTDAALQRSLDRD